MASWSESAKTCRVLEHMTYKEKQRKVERQQTQVSQNEKLQLDIRKKIFAGKVVKHWKRLPRNTVGSCIWRYSTLEVGLDDLQRYFCNYCSVVP